MPSVFEKIAKRSATPVEINGGTIYVREPTFAECKRVKAVTTDERRVGLVLALCLVDESCVVVMTPVNGENDESLADRMLAECDHITPGELAKIHAAIDKLARPVDPEKLAKN